MNRGYFKGLVIIALFWSALFYLGYPMPTIDDICFLGPALNLASGGTFTNPHCPGLDVLGAKDHFFIYMPLHEFVLAGWLRVWGVGRVALASFASICGVVASASLFRLICPPGGRVVFSSLAVSYSVAICLCSRGFRPDALGLALFAGGLQILRAESLPAWFVCSLALGLSVITSPVFGPLAALVVLYCLQRNVGFRLPSQRQYLYRCGVVLTAGAVTTLVFLVLIQFQLSTFVSIFNRARGLATFTENAVSFHDPVSVAKFVIHIALPVATLMVLVLSAKALPSIYERRPGNLECVLLVLSTVALVSLTNSSAFGPPLLNATSVLAALVFVYLLRNRYRTVGLLVWSALFGFFLICCGRNLFLNLELPLCPVPDASAQIQAKLDELKPAYIYIDSSSADKFYHYHLPANAFSFHFGQEDRLTDVPVPEDLPKDSVLVVSTETVEHSFFKEMAKEQTHYVFKPMLLVGPLYPVIPANPYELIFVKVNKDSLPAPH